MHHWILKGRKPVLVDLMTWARWFEEIENRRVAWTQITPEVFVSTVFMGLNHNFSGTGPPILFETMIHGVNSDGGWGHQSRYATWTEAEQGHELAVEWTRSIVGLAETEAAAALAKIGLGA